MGMNANEETRTFWVRLGRCFLTPEALDILLHLSLEEEDLFRQKAKTESWKENDAWPLALIIFVAAPVMFLQFFLGWPWWVWPSFYVAELGVYFLSTRSSRRKYFARHKEMLCQTEYARAQGITPENLTVYRWPWSRG
jgi:hypothetical protein